MKINKKNIALTLSIVTAVTLFTIGCGGGGGSETSKLDIQKISMNDTPEMERIRFFKEVHAGIEAKEFNVTGDGVRVTVMGEIADATHKDLEKRIHKQYNTYSQKGKVIEGSGNQPYMFEKFGRGDGHGTHIAGTIAAECDGKGLQGVACGSTIDLYDIAVYGKEDIPVKGWSESNEYSVFIGAFTDALKDVTKRGESKIVTGSFNIESPYIRYKKEGELLGKSIYEVSKKVKGLNDILDKNLVTFEDATDKEYLKNITKKNGDEDIPFGTILPLTKEWSELEDAISAYQKSGGVYIVTESNNIFDNRTSVLNAMPTMSDKVDPELWISTVMVIPKGYQDAKTVEEAEALRAKNEYITPINSCGEDAKEYCILTPSYEVISTMTQKVAESEPIFFILDGRGYQMLSGHSMGAPMIAATLALMQEYNKKMNKGYSMKDLVRILKESANRSFVGYDPKVHGQGMLDVKAALEAM